MLDKITKRIVEVQVSSGAIEKADAPIYEYGYFLLIQKMLIYIMIGILAVVFHVYYEVFVISVCLIPLRTYAGGYHAKSSFNCLFLSALMVGACVWGANYLLGTALFPYILLLESMLFGIFLWLAPVSHPNKPVSENEKKVFKKRAIIIYGIELIIEIGSVGFGIMSLASLIFLSHGAMLVSLLIGKYLNPKQA